MHVRKILFFLLLQIALFCGIHAQIFAPSADHAILARYGTDSVFIFNRPAFNSPITAAIRAVGVDSSAGWTFEWSVFDRNLLDYRSIPGAFAGAVSTIDTITVSSGFKVRMIKDTIDKEFRTWVIINDLDVFITNKDNADTLLYGYYNCTSLDLRADSVRPPLYYYNPNTKAKTGLTNSYFIRWTASNPEAENPNGSTLFVRVYDPPASDTWYILTINDAHGLVRSDSVFYKSIQSEAQMNVNYISLTDTTVYPDKPWYDLWYSNDEKHSAPAKFRFDLSASKNLSNYMITFGDEDTVFQTADSLHLIHEYEKPGPDRGAYKAVLTTKSAPPYECIDTVTVEITVDYATAEDFEMPNVFTPDKDKNYVYKWSGSDNSGINDILRTEDISVLYIDITIFSRTGLKVHHYEGPIREWEGWDGNIMDSGRKAPEGVYYYIISELYAWQDPEKPLNKGNFKGFIHLFRH